LTGMVNLPDAPRAQMPRSTLLKIDAFAMM